MSYVVLVLTLILVGAWFGYYRSGIDPKDYEAQAPWGVVIFFLLIVDLAAIAAWLIRSTART